MKIQFESNLEYQDQAISAIVDIFSGQDACKSNFTVYSPEYIAKNPTFEYNDLGSANKLELTEDKIIENVQKIQLRNGLKPSLENEIDKKNLDFSIEMETGTGKTYVYLRTIFELNQKYGFSKFIIVPGAKLSISLIFLLVFPISTSIFNEISIKRSTWFSFSAFSKLDG